MNCASGRFSTSSRRTKNSSQLTATCPPNRGKTKEENVHRTTGHGKINDEGGEVGPDLGGIGQRQTREYILESILFPNKNIAPGFESAIVALKNGNSFAGVVKSEKDIQLVIHSPNHGLLMLKKQTSKSATTDCQRCRKEWRRFFPSKSCGT
jgi:putative heme-binding domain-containing protein